MLENFFTQQRAFKGKLGTQKALEGHLGTRALTTLGHLGARALEALRHSKDTWALGHSRHLALGHLSNRGTRDTLFSRLCDNFIHIFLCTVIS